MLLKRTSLFAIAITLGLISCQSLQRETAAPQPPNIILIMGDDMGFSDLGCYGGEIRTPNLDRLAANGLRFTQFYNTARCCPTRASLLTGLYPQQAGIGHMVDDRGTEAFRGDLSDRAVTIAEVMKGAGYETYMSGKWHVTPYVVEDPDQKNWPRQRGFDKFFGMISGAGSLYDPRSLALDNEYVAPRDGFYCTTDFTDYALQCIEEHQSENPFFMYLAYTAAHWPMHAPASAIARYDGQYDKGWDAVRQERYQRMQEMGIIDPSWELTPRDSFVAAWSEDIPDREWEIANMEVYAAMVELMDEGIGRIIASLEARGALDNTLIFFLQDNGACAEELAWVKRDTSTIPAEPMPPGAIQTLMVPEVTRDGKRVKLMKDAMPGPPESYTAYGLNWANASNTPFREYKHWVHEGGISTPLIVHWPAGFSSRGTFRSEPSHLIDIMATCVDVSGAVYPEEYRGNRIRPMEGKSLQPVFTEQPLDREAIFWEHEGNRAVRMGKWKLISKASKQRSFLWDKIDSLAPENWELFDMEADRTEMHDLAGAHPDLVRQMSGMWLEWGKRTGIVPRPYDLD
ncbi:arylsulfatase [Flavilitoribacter nigricans]|uniref:Arylsulfatase n=1 Tax=Flavilitoribacter nigricans (strain ATCC 23147 / DSM 23189 / NBRC 102662 / NCIMB 1420 / SS-2) TaxID=1122177 RepID=A0A2D0NHX6_FLAN2|nr:arylsulfatase [Flavilitoribacter nigricans]PHN08114.1 arylsulfatase [Flavilitoribacter nigricans DSM 23189 = NBRC 102662]